MSRGRSNSYSWIEVIFSEGFKGNPMTWSSLTSSTSASNSREAQQAGEGGLKGIEKSASLDIVG